MFPSLLVSVFLAVSTLVQASPVVSRDGSDFFSGFIDELNQLGATVTAKLWRDNINDYLLGLLQSQAVSVLIPENNACDSNYPPPGDDPQSILAYTLLFGTPEDGFKITNSSLTRKGAAQSRSAASSGLQWPPRSSRKRWNGILDNNQVQIVDQFKSTSEPEKDPIIIDRAVDSATVVRRAVYKNIDILITDRIFTLPTTVSDLLCKPLLSSTPNGFKTFGGGLQKAGLLDDVDKGFKSTVFAPTDEAFEEVGLSGRKITASLLKNHYFFGTIVYSTLFSNIPEATAESGKELYFSYEEGVHYVRCGSSKAIILRSDVISKWGVLHVIDTVLKCD